MAALCVEEGCDWLRRRAAGGRAGHGGAGGAAGEACSSTLKTTKNFWLLKLHGHYHSSNTQAPMWKLIPEAAVMIYGHLIRHSASV